MRKLIILIILLAFISVESKGSSAPFRTRHSSISKCRSHKVTDDYEILKCRSVKDYDVFIEVMDMYSGILIRHKNSKYNTVEMINEVPAGRCTVGAFTYVSGKKIEWLYLKKNLVGIIVKVSGTDILSEDNKEISSKCVIKIDERKNSTIIGLADTFKEARELLKHNL